VDKRLRRLKFNSLQTSNGGFAGNSLFSDFYIGENEAIASTDKERYFSSGPSEDLVYVLYLPRGGQVRLSPTPLSHLREVGRA
jgi:hypothetical protein